jgi:hypothetical protein
MGVFMMPNWDKIKKGNISMGTYEIGGAPPP